MLDTAIPKAANKLISGLPSKLLGTERDSHGKLYSNSYCTKVGWAGLHQTWVVFLRHDDGLGTNFASRGG